MYICDILCMIIEILCMAYDMMMYDNVQYVMYDNIVHMAYDASVW